MGDLSGSPAVTEKFDNIRRVVRKTTDNHKGLQAKLKSITEINTKLSQSYDVSLRVIVDVSKLLNQYISFFNDIDGLLSQLDIDASNASTGDYVKYINRLTSDNLDKMTQEFKTQLDKLVPLFQKNDMPSQHLVEYGQLLDGINKEAKQLVRGGGAHGKSAKKLNASKKKTATKKK
jgi:hypothetical protein